MCPPGMRLAPGGELCVEREPGPLIVQQQDTPLARSHPRRHEALFSLIFRPKKIPETALSYEEILIEAAVKQTVEGQKKLLKLNKDDIVDKKLSQEVLIKAVKQSLSEEGIQICIQLLSNSNDSLSRLSMIRMFEVFLCSII